MNKEKHISLEQLLNLPTDQIPVEPNGGNFLTHTLLFERPDLLEKCPEEVQRAIKLLHQSIYFDAHADHENSRVYLEAFAKAIPHLPTKTEDLDTPASQI